MGKIGMLVGCTYNNEICFVYIEPKSIVFGSVRLRQSPSCVRERPASAADEDVYTWVSHAYK